MDLFAVISLFFSLVALILGFLIVKKLYYRWHLKKRFFIIPRVSSHGISNIGMILALSIAIILFLILVTANAASLVFRLWAGTRILIEGVLIKIGGLLFGPIIGMCLGAAIDILTITYSGGLFHFGYFMSAILFGLIGGLIRMLVTNTNNSLFRFSLVSSILSTVIIMSSLIPIIISPTENYYISLFNFDLSMSRNFVILLLVSLPIVGVSVLWLCYFIQSRQLKRNKNAKVWYKNFAPVFITILITEIVINIIFMPYFDASVSTLSYETWVATRIVLFLPMVVANVIIILPVYSIINPIFKYRYEDELVEDMDAPLYIE